MHIIICYLKIFQFQLLGRNNPCPMLNNRTTVKYFFSDKMSDFVFIKVECETVDVKEEYLEEGDPMNITSNSDRGK